LSLVEVIYLTSDRLVTTYYYILCPFRTVDPCSDSNYLHAGLSTSQPLNLCLSSGFDRYYLLNFIHLLFNVH